MILQQRNGEKDPQYIVNSYRSHSSPALHYANDVAAQNLDKYQNETNLEAFLRNSVAENSY